MRSSYKRLLLTLVLSMVFTVVMPHPPHLRAQAPSQWHFGANVIVLTPPENDRGALIAPMVMSPSGQYVAGATLTDTTPAIYVWDVSPPVPQSGVAQITPAQRASLRPLLRDHKAFYNALIAFSPDERYLAVVDDVSIKLLTVPALQETRAISVNSLPLLSQPAWSSDSQLLASVANEGTELIVWNTQTNTTYRRTFDATYSRSVSYVNGEWILTAISGSVQHPSAFAVCTRLLEQCTSYFYPGIIDSIASKANVLASHRVDEQNRYVAGVWVQQDDGAYLLNEERLQSGHTLCQQPRSLSPEGQYLFCDGANGESLVWDLDRDEVIQQLAAPSWSPFWAGENILVTKSFSQNNGLLLNLHRIGQGNKVPVNQLDFDQIDFPGLYDLIDPERFTPMAVGGNGLMLVSLGYGALLIPIMYE